MTLDPKLPAAPYALVATSVDLTSPGSIIFWTRFWNVTLIQLRIAVGRAGRSPADIAKELGLGAHAVELLPIRVATPDAVSQELQVLA
jgi:hypothetical protein